MVGDYGLPRLNPMIDVVRHCLHDPQGISPLGVRWIAPCVAVDITLRGLGCMLADGVVPDVVPAVTVSWGT